MVFLLSVVGLEIGGKNKKDLQAVLDKYALQEAIPEDLGNIGMCRLESTMKEEQAKPLIAPDQSPLFGRHYHRRQTA